MNKKYFHTVNAYIPRVLRFSNPGAHREGGSLSVVVIGAGKPSWSSVPMGVGTGGSGEHSRPVLFPTPPAATIVPPSTRGLFVWLLGHGT